MAGTFQRRTDELARRVGRGKVTSSVKIDQIYAQYQHQRADLKHRGGGQPMFLTNAVMKGYPKWYNQIANHLYSPLGVNHWMIRIADNMASESKRRTPTFLRDLVKSTEPRVKEGGAFIYRGGAKARLSKEQLRAKSRLYSQMNRVGKR